MVMNKVISCMNRAISEGRNRGNCLTCSLLLLVRLVSKHSLVRLVSLVSYLMRHLKRAVLLDRVIGKINKENKLDLVYYDVYILVYLGTDSLTYEGIRKAGLTYGRSHSQNTIFESVNKLESLGLVLIDRSSYFHSICVSSSGYYILSSLENLLKKIRV